MAMSQTELEELVVRLTGDASQYLETLRTAQTQTQSSMFSIQNMVDRAKGAFTGVTGQVMSLIGVGLTLGTVFKSVQLAAEAEKMQVSFSVMLESAEKGLQMTQQLQRFAAATPLNMPEIQQAAKTLLQFGVTASDILPTLKQLGDVTGGDTERFNRMALAFGQMTATGRLMGQDLLQMINAGFNPLKELSRTTGKSMAMLHDDMEHGRISLDMIRGAFASATSEGGQFFNLMQEQSQTIKGLFSTMQDDVDALLRAFGGSVAEGAELKDMMKAVSNAAQSATEWTKEHATEIKAVVALVAVFLTGVAAAGAALALWASPVAAAVGVLVAAAVAVDQLNEKLLKTPKDVFEDIRENVKEATHDRGFGMVKEFARESQRVSEIEDPAAQRVEAEETVRRLEEQMKSMQETIKETEKEYNNLNDFANNYFRNPELARARGKLEGQRALLKDMGYELDQIKKRQKDKDANPIVDKLLKQYQQEYLMAGKTAAERAKITAQLANATEAQQENVYGAALLAEQTKEISKAKEAANKLQLEINAVGMTEAQRTLYLAEQEARLKGNFGWRKEELRLLREKLEAEEHLAHVTKTYDEAQRKLDEGLSITMKHNPIIKYQEEAKKLDNLLYNKALGPREYALAMKELGKEFYHAAGGITEAWTAMQKFDAVEAGSAEGLARSLAFAESVREQSNPARRGEPTPEMAARFGPGTGMPPGFQAAEAGGAEGRGKMDQQIQLTQQMRDLLKELVKKRGGALQPLNIGGR